MWLWNATTWGGAQGKLSFSAALVIKAFWLTIASEWFESVTTTSSEFKIFGHCYSNIENNPEII